MLLYSTYTSKYLAKTLPKALSQFHNKALELTLDYNLALSMLLMLRKLQRHTVNQALGITVFIGLRSISLCSCVCPNRFPRFVGCCLVQLV